MKYLYLLLCCFCTIGFSQSIEKEQYFRHLRYNHISPFIPLAGTYPISKIEAQKSSHYIFKYDQKNRIIEIINHHYQTERKHPLASIGVYKMVITYTKTTETRIFFDFKGQRISNDRGVYKEVYTLNKKGEKTALTFFDQQDQPMESNWKIARYQWKKHKKMIIEQRFNLKDQPAPISPYFPFEITGIRMTKNNYPQGHYNLDKNYRPLANKYGVASYQDTYDKEGNHVKYAYYDPENKLTTNQWGFAFGIKKYDTKGNQIGLAQYDTIGKLIRQRKVASNAHIRMAKPSSRQDTTEIKRIAEGYLIALQQMKPALMQEVLNDSLNKVTIGYNRKIRKEVATATTYKQMIDFAHSWNKAKNKFPVPPNNKVYILDIYNRIANVKLVSDNWVEYLHLIKLDGKWSIVNLIWQHKNLDRYPD